MWIKAFKIAIAERNIEEIDALIRSTPEFESIENMKEALYLIKEATTLIKASQNDILKTKNKLKKNIEFMQSAQSHSTSKFDTNQ
ncbi:MAG: hypothetical protein U9N52_13180 [Campylobacterota bacterium]|nr:hypothetical protein [Campylobacterota bacterium]